MFYCHTFLHYKGQCLEKIAETEKCKNGEFFTNDWIIRMIHPQIGLLLVDTGVMECVKDLRFNRCGQVTAYDLDLPENSRIMYFIIGKKRNIETIDSCYRKNGKLFCPFISFEICFPIVIPQLSKFHSLCIKLIL